MTDLMTYRMESKLRLPSYFVEVTDNEMEYLDGGAWSWGIFGNWIGTTAIAGAIGLGCVGAAAGSFIPLAGTAAGATIGAGIGFAAGTVIGIVAYALFGWWN